MRLQNTEQQIESEHKWKRRMESWKQNNNKIKSIE